MDGVLELDDETLMDLEFQTGKPNGKISIEMHPICD